MEKIFKTALVNRCLTDVPVFEDHKRGKNWAATITFDDQMAPERGFWEKCKPSSPYYYLLPKEAKIGDLVEFGADYLSGSGHRAQNRKFYKILGISEKELVLFRKDDWDSLLEAHLDEQAAPVTEKAIAYANGTTTIAAPIAVTAPVAAPVINKLATIMSRAWEIAKQAASKFAASCKEFFAQALKQAWTESRVLA